MSGQLDTPALIIMGLNEVVSRSEAETAFPNQGLRTVNLTNQHELAYRNSSGVVVYFPSEDRLAASGGSFIGVNAVGVTATVLDSALAEIVASGGSDVLVKVDGGDSIAGYLGEKLVTGNGITFTTLNPSGIKSIEASFNGVTAPYINSTSGLTATTINAAIDEVDAKVDTNVTNITTNTTNIATNASDIATNTTNIATNTTNIASNATNIATNTTDIATNTTSIATNTTNIATNATNIATNDTDIAANTTNIATNTTNIAANTTLANSKVASVVGSTNITIGGSATAPQVDLNSAITGTSVNNVTLSDGGVATNFLNETGTYSAPTTVPGLHTSTHVSGGTDIIRDATASLNGLATPAQITKLDGIATGADVAPIQSLANVGSGEDVFKQTTGAGIAQFKTLTGGTNVTLDVSSGNDITINASVASDSLQDAYDASTTPEITTDATRGALTIKRGSALDSDNVLEVQNGAGTNVVQATAEGVVTIGDLTIVGPYNMLDWTTSGNTSFIQADYTGAGILGIVSTNGVYIQADTNFGSSDVSGISNLNMSGTATIGGQILVTGPITGLIPVSYTHLTLPTICSV